MYVFQFLLLFVVFVFLFCLLLVGFWVVDRLVGGSISGLLVGLQDDGCSACASVARLVIFALPCLYAGCRVQGAPRGVLYKYWKLSIAHATGLMTSCKIFAYWCRLVGRVIGRPVGRSVFGLVRSVDRSVFGLVILLVGRSVGI